MKEVLYVKMDRLTVGNAMWLYEQGYEVLFLENGYAILTRGGVMQ